MKPKIYCKKSNCWKTAKWAYLLSVDPEHPHCTLQRVPLTLCSAVLNRIQCE